MDGFIGFTDVQIAGSVIFSILWLGFALGALFADGTYFAVKFLIKKLRKGDTDA